MHSSLQASNQGNKFRYLLLASAVAVFLLIVMGGIVRVTESGGTCLDWPTCFGQWTPPAGWTLFNQGPSLDYTHRLLTILVAPLIFITAVIAWRRYSGLRWVKRLLNITVLLMVVQIALGGVFALRSMTGEWNWMSPMHLGLSAGLSIPFCAPFLNNIGSFISPTPQWRSPIWESVCNSLYRLAIV
jgi:heme A synthase